ncbi:MAG: hypothetical protein JSW46_14345 [Gemmatimonadota bacterium]|nr:MAG: hypothetical protein JSW46_14345 [Gemmatimonadota bacterium]
MWLDVSRCWETSFVTLVLVAGSSATPLQAQVAPEVLETAEGLVSEIYDMVSAEAGNVPDWEAVKSLFIPQAVVVLRTSREATTVFSVESFLQDFVNFYENTPAGANGFTERVLAMKSLVFGDMANVLVLYEAQITGSARPPQQGVDNFSLIKQDGRWWIVSVTNEIPTPDRPIPEVLRN